MRCKKCACMLPDTATVCPSCGTPVAGAAAPAPMPTAAPAPMPSAPSGGNKCTSCGADLKPGAKFCPVCGSKADAAPATMPAAAPAPIPSAPSGGNKCTSCGADLKPGAKFCPVCGSKADAAPAPAPAPVPAPTPAPAASSDKCPSCGATLKPGAKFCPVCGSKTDTAPAPAAAPVAAPTPAPATSGDKCPSCGATLKPGAKFCPVCGGKVEQVAATTAPAAPAAGGSKCPSCGADLKPGAIFCPVCGSKANAAPAAPAAASAGGDKCPSCGASLKPGAKFCPVCGSKTDKDLAQTAVIPPIPAAPTSPAPSAPTANQTPSFGGNAPAQNQFGAMPPPAAPKKPVNKTVLFAALGAVAVVAIIIVVIIIIASKPPKIDLENYVDCTFSGYDGSGTANISFDLDKFEQDWGGKLKFSNIPDEYKSLIGDKGAAYFLGYSLKYDFEVDNNYSLHNGDEVKLKWTTSDSEKEEIKKYINCELSYNEKSYTVEGLKGVETVDPFGDISVKFEGDSPNGRAYVYNNSNYYLDIELSKESGLKNGDVVTVTIKSPYGGDLNKYLADDYHVNFSATTKDYTVSGLQSKVQATKDIPADALTKMKSECEDAIKADVPKSKAELKSMDYLGTITLVPKSNDGWYDTYYYCVYRVVINMTDKKTKKAADYSYLTYSRFNEIKVDDTGKVVEDNGYSSSQPYNSYYPIETEYTSFDGYATYDELLDDVVTKNLKNYTSDSDIDEAAVKTPAKPVEESKPETSNPEESSNPEGSNPEGSNPEESSKQDESKPATDYTSLKAFFEDKANKEELESMESSMSNSTVTMKVSVEGDNTLVFTAKLVSQIEVTDAIKSTFETTLNAQESTFKSLLTQLESETGIKDASIKVVYINADDTPICEAEFKN